MLLPHPLVTWQTHPTSHSLPGLPIADFPLLGLLTGSPSLWSPLLFCYYTNLLSAFPASTSLCSCAYFVSEHAKVLFLMHASNLVLPLVAKGTRCIESKLFQF